MEPNKNSNERKIRDMQRSLRRKALFIASGWIMIAILEFTSSLMPGLTSEYIGRFVLGLIAGSFALLTLLSAEIGRRSPRKHLFYQISLGILFLIFFLVHAVIPDTAPSTSDLFENQLEISLLCTYILLSIDNHVLRLVIFGSALIAFIVQEYRNLGATSARTLSRNLVLLVGCALSELTQLRSDRRVILEKNNTVEPNPLSLLFEFLPQGVAVFDEKVKPIIVNRTLNSWFPLSDANNSDPLLSFFEEIGSLKIQEELSGAFNRSRLVLQGLDSIPTSPIKAQINSMTRIASLRKKPSAVSSRFPGTNPSSFTEIDRNDSRAPIGEPFNSLNFENLRKMVEFMAESISSNMNQQFEWNSKTQEAELIRLVGRRNDKTADICIGYIKPEEKHQLFVMIDLRKRAIPQEQPLSLKKKVSEKKQLGFVAIVAHEFRTPLNGTMLMLEASLNDNRVPHDIKANYLEVSLRSLQRLMYLINDLLDISQIKAQKIRISQKPLDVQKLVQDVVKVVKLQASMKGISLRYLVHSNVPNIIVSDENRLQQILINLLANGIKFTFNGYVELAVRRNQRELSMIEFCVNDTGIGINEADQAKLFNEFEKLNSSASLNPNGVGLGLVISNNLAQLLGTGISFTSKEGEGSSFFFSIAHNKTDVVIPSLFSKQRISDYTNRQSKIGSSPLLKPKRGTLETIQERKLSSQTHSLASIEESNNMTSGHIHNMSRLANNYARSFIATSPRSGGRLIESYRLSEKIGTVNKYSEVLIVDDDPFCVLSLEMILKSQGFSTMGAYNGQKAVEIIEDYVRSHQKDKLDSGDIKLIFIDCQMPVMDGFTACKKIKSLLQKEGMDLIPIIGCSGQQFTNDESWKEAGMDDYLLKPLSTDKVLDKLSIYMYQKSIEELLV